MDDTIEFDRQKAEQARAMRSDSKLQLALNLALTEADKYNYTYQSTWLGLPIIQCPADIVAQQEIIWKRRPTVIVETGIARGGSMTFLASMLKLIDGREVIGVDIDIRAHNRKRIEEHFLAPMIHMIEGSSIAPDIAEAVRARLRADDRVMVVLDSNHTHDHVLAELELYTPMVTPGQYAVVADTIIELLPRQDHRPRPWGPGDNPYTAMKEFERSHPEFQLDTELNNKLVLSCNPFGYLRRNEV